MGTHHHASAYGQQFSEDSRVLALDWGAKRVGMAISDPLGITAQGLGTMSRRNRQRDLDYLKLLVNRHNVSLILLGKPLNMDGSEGPAAQLVRTVADDIREHMNIEVRLWDERLTSVEAGRALEEAGVPLSKRRGLVDRMAAVLLLQSFLEAQHHARPMPESEP